jgi:hypothetical protein
MHWVEKTANIPRRLRSSKTVLTPHKFMKYLDDGSMLCRLAGILGQNQINEIPTEKKKRYEYFYKFAKEEAKLAEGCVCFWGQKIFKSWIFSDLSGGRTFWQDLRKLQKCLLHPLEIGESVDGEIQQEDNMGD